MKFDFKNSTKEELKVKYDEIATQINDDQFLRKKELNYLPEVLEDKEQVLSFSSGFMDGRTWLITLTDKRIIFLSKGIIYGIEQVDINLDAINTISGKTSILFGSIFIQDGTYERKIENVRKSTVEPFTDIVMKAMEDNKQPIKKPTVPTKAQKTIADPFENLEKLAALKEKGIVSEHEFNIAKRNLLDNL